MSNRVETLSNGTQVYCSANHRFGTDALLLARFCPPRRDWKAVDLCSGCGIVALEWYDAGHRGSCTAVELSPEGSAQLAAALAAQGITSIHPHCGDLRAFPPMPELQGQVQLIACNPPYFELQTGAQSALPAHAIARHENECKLTDVCACAARLLKDGGRFALCHRPSRMAEVFAVLKQYRLEPKRLVFVKNKADGAPWLFLVEAQKNRKVGLVIEPDILISAGMALY
ncbi:MAG: SAM-dependent methyltransferase [Faecalibacterium sp.]